MHLMFAHVRTRNAQTYREWASASRVLSVRTLHASRIAAKQTMIQLSMYVHIGSLVMLVYI